MKLLFVVDHFGSGGAQRQMVNLALGLVRRGHRVEFFVYYPEFQFFRSMVDGAGIPVFEVQKRDRLGLGVLRALRRRIVDGGYSAVLAFMETPSVYAELAQLAHGGVPLVVSERIDPPPGSSGILLRGRAALHRVADRIVANSHACRIEWGRRFPSLAGRLETIWNGIDLEAFAPGEQPHAHEDQLGVVAVGTLVPRKNAHGIIASMREIRRRAGVVPKVTWIGKDDDSEMGRSYRRQIEQLLRDAGLEGQWLWAGEQSRVELALRRADVLVHASFQEGLSNVVCEALASGCPVLAADVGDNRLLIGDSERGALFDPADPISLANRLEEFLRLSSGKRQQLRLSARAFAEKELGLERFVDRYEALFRSIAQAK